MSIEQLVRPFTRIDSAPLAQIVPAPLSNLEALPPAYLAWGLPSRFISSAMQVDNPFVVGIPDSDAIRDIDALTRQLQGFVNRIEQTESIFDYEPEVELPEIERVVSIVRVYNPVEVEEIPNPSERTMWVDVERIDAITFRSPEGANWKFTLNHEGVAVDGG